MSSWNVFELIVPSRIPSDSACSLSFAKSSTSSQGMCSATLGASPVEACTCAASASFSNGSRGTPCCANTLNRVPELPYAHDGTSIACVVELSPSTSLLKFHSSPLPRPPGPGRHEANHQLMKRFKRSYADPRARPSTTRAIDGDMRGSNVSKRDQGCRSPRRCLDRHGVQRPEPPDQVRRHSPQGRKVRSRSWVSSRTVPPGSCKAGT